MTDSTRGRRPPDGEEPELKRSLSNRHIQLIAIGGAIGTGLFMGSGKTISLAGPSIIFVYMIIGFMLFFVMRAMGELLLSNLKYKSFIDFSADLLGPWAGFFTGWTYWFCWIVTGIADVIAISAYSQFWFPDIPLWLPALACVALLLSLNLLTVKLFGELEFWFAMIKIVAICALICTGMYMVAAAYQSPVGHAASLANLWNDQGMFPHGAMGFFAGFQIAVFAFVGIELVGTTAAETKNPERNLPRAINSIPVRIIVFYVLALIAIMVVTPWRDVVANKSPFVELFMLAGLPAAAGVINFVVLTSAASSANSGVFSTSRMLYGLAMEGDAPGKFGTLSSRAVPSNGLIFSCVCLAAGALVIYLMPNMLDAFTLITTVSAILFMFVWSMILLSYLTYRKQRAQLHRASTYKMPGGTLMCWVCLAFFAFILGLLALEADTRLALYLVPVCVVLSMFSFAKYLMWKDLAENAEHLRQSPVVQHLLDTPRDSFASDTPFPEPESLDRDYGPTEVFCPLPSDSSQLAAVMAAAKGKDFVLIGPPGTGKSQTISNMIAQSIAQGRRVLFVSEKIAALDVVYRRLREIGLGEFCLELHSSKARKTDVLAQLQSAWEAKGQVDSAAWEVEAQRLASLRDSLNIYVERLHRRHRNGYCVYDAIGTITSGVDEAVTPVAWASPDIHDQKAMLELRELGNRLEVNAQAVGYSQLAGNALSAVGQAEWSPHWQQQFVQAARDVLPAVMDVQRAADRFVELSGLPATEHTPTALEGLSILSQALPAAAGQDWRFALRPDARSISQRLNDGCAWVEQHRSINSRLSALWPSRVAADAKQGIELLQQRRATYAELGPAWPESVTEVLGQAVTLQEQIADLKQQLSATYSDAIESLDTDLLLREWKEAEESFWPKSWFGKRRIAALLVPTQSTAGEADHGKDLATWAEIRSVRRAIDELEPGHECVAVWQGSKSDPVLLSTSIKLQEAIRLQKADSDWVDDGFQLVEQGQLGDALKGELRRLRALTRFDAEMSTLSGLRSSTDSLWSGLSTDIDVLAAALRFQAERRDIEDRGRLVDEHPQVEEGRCGASLKSDFELLKQRATVERDLADLADLRELVPVWKDLKTKLDVARQAVAFHGQMAIAVAKLALTPEQIAAYKAPLQTLLGDGNALLEPEGAIVLAGVALREKLGLLQERSSQLTSIGHFTETGVDETAHLSLSDLKKNCETVVSSEPRLRAWCAWRKVRDEAFAVGLAPIVQAMESGVITSGKVRRVLEVNYARWWLNTTVDNEEVIRTFVSVEHEQRIRDFRALDEKFTELTKDWLRARLCADLPSQDSVSRSSEWGLLRHEMGKKTKHIPLRELMTRAPEALTKLTPCLLMSPLSIAQYLPPASTPFDLVIFDEASQIPVWDAIGAMARGKQVVMVGDPKQLPPTSFFDRAESTADDEDVEADLESILDECISANLPMRNLNWHYRSRHESLIAFSNQRYYQSKLVTFPSPFTADQAVRMCPVAGVYDKGGSRTNLIEARALVADLVARLQSPAFRESGRTVGVVTFNGEQQKLIMDMLDEACRKDPSLDSYFAESELEPVFVKNLESVQGDERDIIYFSTTYGKDAAGAMSMNFGPMNRPGGERRLNVAITRARQELVLFSTLRPEHIDLARTQAVGVRDLKHFLEFAERGPRALAEVNFGSVGGFDSPFEEAVAAALAKKGWQIHTQIGVSSFRVDLGVVHPDAPGRFLAGVECDGATYHRSATARDRDKLREFVLRGLGWEIVRIWSTDWWVDAAGTAEKVHQRLNELLAASRAKQAAIDAAQEAERQRVDAAMAEVIKVVDQVTVVASVSDTEEANDPAGALPEVKYARAVTVAAVEDVVTTAKAVEHLIYKEADPSNAVEMVNPDQFFEPGYTITLEQMIDLVVTEEGPVLDTALARRIARAHGWVRTGSRIRERVDQIARARFRLHEEEQIGVFYWPAHLESDAKVVFRRPGEDDSTRALADICLQELRALVNEMLERGHEGEALIYAIAKEAGVSKLAHAGRQRIERAIRE